MCRCDTRSRRDVSERGVRSLVGDMLTPNGLGTAFLVFQAVAVALFAELQFVALRRRARFA